MTDERDPVVAGALAAVPVPAHRGDFWARLDEALADEPVPIARPRPAVVPDPGRPSPGHGPRPDPIDLPPAARRRPQPRGRWLAAVAAVVVLVGAAVGARLLRDDAPSPRTFGADATSPSTGTGPGTAPAPSTTTTPFVASAAATAVDFLERVGNGDVPGARALLGPMSLAYLPTQGGIDETLRESAEGYGAWVTSIDRTTTTISLDARDAVVVVQGTRRQEGGNNDSPTAVPMVQAADGTWQVELWAFDAGVEDAQVAIGAPDPVDVETARYALAAGDDVTVVGQSTGRAWFSLDGGAAEAAEVTGGSWSTDFVVPVEPQRNGVLVVAFRSATSFNVLAVHVDPRQG